MPSPADQTTYRTATTAAIAGLVIQLLLAVATGLIGVWAASPAIQAVAWHMLGGLPIWVILARSSPVAGSTGSTPGGCRA